MKLILKIYGGSGEWDHYETIIPVQLFENKDNLEFNILESLDGNTYSFNNYFFTSYEIMTLDEWFNKECASFAINYYKDNLLSYFHDMEIKPNDVMSLWASCKDYFNSENIKMGGSYHSTSNEISISLNNGDNLIRFKLTLNEI